MRRYLILLLLLLVSVGYSQVKFSGDARIRPRYDINDQTASGKSKTTDFYYMYRARLRMTADIGEGWMFNAMLSHNGISDYSIFNAGEYPDVSGVNQTTTISSNESARRATISFMELYFGKELPDYGFRVGLIPAGSMVNPLYDLHYYPKKMVDIPFAILNTDGMYGAAGYIKTGFGKFGAKVIVEDAKGKYEENAAGKELMDVHDQYTFELNYSNTFEGFVISPQVMLSISKVKDSLAAPNTVGLNVTAPKFMGMVLSATGGYSVQNMGTLAASRQEPGLYASRYRASFMRLKAIAEPGFGTITAWFDYGHVHENPTGIANKYEFLYTWIGYEIPVFKSDKGAVTISPTVRYANMIKNSMKTADRLKAEMNFDIKF